MEKGEGGDTGGAMQESGVGHSTITSMPGKEPQWRQMALRFLRSSTHRMLVSIRQRRNRKELVAMLPEILSTLDASEPGLGAGTWVVRHIYPTEPDTLVAAIGPLEGCKRAVVNIPRSEQRISQLVRRIEVKQALAAIPEIDEWRRLIPRELAFNITDGQPYLLQEYLPGINLQQLSSDDAAYTRAHMAAVRAISRLHWSTATEVRFDEEHVRRWVYEPLRRIEQELERRSNSYGEDAAIILLLKGHLSDVLIGHSGVVSWIHGDYWQENILVNPEGTDVTGIVDWEWAACNELSSFDVINLLLSRRWLTNRSTLGAVTIDVLREGKWTAMEQAMIEASTVNGGSQPASMRTPVLLWWLWHIRCSLTRRTRYVGYRRWFADNVSSVLSEIRDGMPLE